MASARALLVVVSGPPAAGKTRLTGALRDELQLPLLSRDRIKEAMMAVLRPRSVDETDRLSRAAERVLASVAATLVDAGPGALLESPFHVDRAAAELGPLAERSRMLIVHCQAPKEVLVARYRERAERGERATGHMDRARAGQLPAKLEAGDFEPPKVGAPVLRVDTEEDYDPPLAEVLRWVRGQVAPSS